MRDEIDVDRCDCLTCRDDYECCKGQSCARFTRPIPGQAQTSPEEEVRLDATSPIEVYHGPTDRRHVQEQTPPGTLPGSRKAPRRGQSGKEGKSSGNINPDDRRLTFPNDCAGKGWFSSILSMQIEFDAVAFAAVADAI